MEKVSSFETTEYSGEESPTEAFEAIVKIAKDFKREAPNVAITVAVHLGRLRIVYHVSEIGLSQPGKLMSVRADGEKALSGFQKHLKKEFKKAVGHELKLKEDKGLAREDVQKTSLNERYYFTLCRFYELGD